MTTSAPSARSRRDFSWDILSGMVKMQRYPFTAAAIASPTPVFPDVASTITPPGLSRPSRSAASIIASPIRSFTEPPGLKNSALAYPGVRMPAVTRLRESVASSRWSAGRRRRASDVGASWPAGRPGALLMAEVHGLEECGRDRLAASPGGGGAHVGDGAGGPG